MDVAEEVFCTLDQSIPSRVFMSVGTLLTFHNEAEIKAKIMTANKKNLFQCT